MGEETAGQENPKSNLVRTLAFLENDLKEVERKKKHYQQKECPYCHKIVGNLGNHVKLKHQVEAATVPPPEVTKEELLGQPAPRQQVPAPPNPARPPVYYCQDCKAELRRSESSCWHCGATLNWEGIE